MTCSEFVECFSEVIDGIASPEVMREAEEHLASCTLCRRYREVLERGADLLRSLPAPEVRDDFVPRLQHRIYHVDQDEALRRHASSGATALAVLGMAVLFAVVAWAPVLRRGAPVVELPPIVVNRPPPAARARAMASFTAFAANSRAPVPQPLAAGLWGDARTLLFEYSRLARRYEGGGAFGRSGLEQEDQ